MHPPCSTPRSIVWQICCILPYKASEGSVSVAAVWQNICISFHKARQGLSPQQCSNIVALLSYKASREGCLTTAVCQNCCILFHKAREGSVTTAVVLLCCIGDLSSAVAWLLLQILVMLK